MRRACSVLASLLLTSALPVGVASGQPDVDIERARQLYAAAEQAMARGDAAEAARNYQAAFELTGDAALHWKLGNAKEKAGDCEGAVVEFRLYLANGKPEPRFVELTQQRIAACGKQPNPTVTPTPNPKPPPARTPSPTPKAHGRDLAWIATGAAIALATTGVVLAFATASSEDDVKDLYLGDIGVPPAYTSSTAAKLQQLLDEGHNYEHLAWLSFGLAAVSAGAATALFVTGRHAAPGERATRIVPVVQPGGGGVAAVVSF
jgi:hypothetical protein